jgi:cation transport ATPase
MSTVTLPTTLHCQGCVDSIKPYFNSSPKVKDWKVDLKAPVKTITVTGENIGREDVTNLLREAGYDVLTVSNAPSNELPTIGNQSGSFWGDREKWNRAAFNTLNCLIGCSLGDFGAVVIMQGLFPGTPMMTQMIVAVISGLVTSVSLESVLLKRREQFSWGEAFTTALSMSFLSMIAMETAMNTSDFMITGGKSAFTTPQYWMAFAIASVVGFLTPLPYNYYKLKKYNKACH